MVSHTQWNEYERGMEVPKDIWIDLDHVGSGSLLDHRFLSEGMIHLDRDGHWRLCGPGPYDERDIIAPGRKIGLFNHRKYRFLGSSELVLFGDVVIPTSMISAAKVASSDQHIGELASDYIAVVRRAAVCIPANTRICEDGFRWVDEGEWLLETDFATNIGLRVYATGESGSVARDGVSYQRPIGLCPGMQCKPDRSQIELPVGYQWDDTGNYYWLGWHEGVVRLSTMPYWRSLDAAYKVRSQLHSDMQPLYSTPSCTVEYVGMHTGSIVETYGPVMVLTFHGISIVEGRTGFTNESIVETSIGNFFPHYFRINGRLSLVYCSDRLSGTDMCERLARSLSRMSMAVYRYLHGREITTRSVAHIEYVHGRRVEL